MLEKKKQPTAAEISRLMMVREVFHECVKDRTVCVVLPDDVEEAVLFGNYYQAVSSRLRRKNVMVVSISDLSVEHIENNQCVVDLSEMRITL